MASVILTDKSTEYHSAITSFIPSRMIPAGVPSSTGSVTDFVANIRKSASADDINDAYREAAAGSMAGILDYTDEPLVSSDFIGNPHSTIIDGLSTMSLEENMVKVVGWYDNEWGYSCRTADLAAFLVDRGL